MFKKILTLFIITISVLGLSACGEKATDKTEKTGVAYGITHKEYVGVATVKVKAEKVTEAKFDEYYMPKDWAKVKVLQTEVPADVVADGATWYGKYLVIGTKHFTGVLRVAPLVVDGVTYSNQKVKYSAEGIDDLYLYLRTSEANRKWYGEELAAGNAFVAKADFTKSTYETAGPLNSESKLGFTKSTTNYWKGANFPLGWAVNMAEIEKVLLGTKMDTTVDNITLNTDKKWVVGGVVSGATNQDFKDYYTVAQTAYNKALGSK